MKELFLFVRPPRPQWPFNGPSSAVWPPLAFASMAAALREHHRDLRVAILDAPALHMGWRSLEAEMRRLRPSFIGIGEEAVSCAEGLRLAHIAKGMGARVIAGGCFFSYVAEEAIGTGLIDVVVHGEGEITLVELLTALRSGTAWDLGLVRGISYGDSGSIRRTLPRPLIPDLDTLPLPAYDLLPVDRYGSGSRNHPDLAAIELGRGCYGACDFCVLWRQMGRYQETALLPQLRTKSPERLVEEIRILTAKYRRRYLGWVDPCFNAHPQVPGRLAELLLEKGLLVSQSAWVRADAIVRDAASGALANCVRAGLNEVYLGLERADDTGLKALNKTLPPGAGRQAVNILSRDFPEVFTVGSFIYGLAGDTPKTLRSLHRFSSDLGLDYLFFIPLTPLPGTPFWTPKMWDPTGEKFRSFGFLPGSLSGACRGPLERGLWLSNLFRWNRARLGGCMRGILHHDPRKRRMIRRLMIRGAAFEARRSFQSVFGRSVSGGMYFPQWYEN